MAFIYTATDLIDPYLLFYNPSQVEAMIGWCECSLLLAAMINWCTCSFLLTGMIGWYTCSFILATMIG